MFYLPLFGFLLVCLFAFPVLLPLRFLPHHGVLFIPLPLPSPLCGAMGHRPYGLEEDVRQYEQDLAKRLYQARVRASQGTAAPPQLPTTSSASSSAASQLRSAPRAPATRARCTASWGCAGVLWRWFICARGKVSEGPSKHSQHQRCNSASTAFLVSFCFCTSCCPHFQLLLVPPRPVLSSPSPQHSSFLLFVLTQY